MMTNVPGEGDARFDDQAHATTHERRGRWRRRRRAFGVVVFVAVVFGLGALLYMTLRDPAADDVAKVAARGARETTSTTPLPPPAGPYQVTDGLNVRSGPGLAYDVIDRIQLGYEVTVVCWVDGDEIPGLFGPSTMWLRIESLAPEAYVTAVYVDGRGELTNPDVVAPCPAS